MLVIRADDGESYESNLTLLDVEQTRPFLKAYLSEVTGVDANAILCFLSDGTQLRNENLRELAGVEDRVRCTFDCFAAGFQAHVETKLKNSGGSWHVAGMANERIIAPGIYYYGSENITESRLAFRAAVGQGDINYLQGDELGPRSTEGNQILGAVKAAAGRYIAFPNVFQHKISSLELSDPSKPGYRKIVAFFLIDPEYTIPSTAHIAPQQSEWTQDAMSATGTSFSKMATEILDM